MIDKEIIKARFESSLNDYDLFATAQDEICQHLSELITEHGANLKSCETVKILEIGAGTGFLTRRVAAQYPCARFTINDLTEGSFNFVSKYIDKVRYIVGDAEQVELGSGYDLVCSSSTCQWFDNFSYFVRRAHDQLNTGGVFAFSTFGKYNFREIKETTGVGLNYLRIADIEKILIDSGFEILSSEEYFKEMIFDTPQSVLRHIKVTGVGIGRGERWTKSRLYSFKNQYCQDFPASGPVSGGVTLTYHPILVIARRR